MLLEVQKHIKVPFHARLTDGIAGLSRALDVTNLVNASLLLRARCCTQTAFINVFAHIAVVVETFGTPTRKATWAVGADTVRTTCMGQTLVHVSTARPVITSLTRALVATRCVGTLGIGRTCIAQATFVSIMALVYTSVAIETCLALADKTAMIVLADSVSEENAKTKRKYVLQKTEYFHQLS